MFSVGLVSLFVLLLISGVVQFEWIMKFVSTLGGTIVQERERVEPDNNTVSTADTTTDGLGTKARAITNYIDM